MFIYLPVYKHGVYNTLNLDDETGGGVHIQLIVMGVVIELSLSFIDVILSAKNDNCGTFIRRFNNHVSTLSKFAEGNPFLGRKVVSTSFLIVYV